MSDLRDRLQTILGDSYILERELGAGGMAVVYLAHDRKHQRRVALKVLRAEVGQAIGRDRFLREVEVTARLQHPHILPVFDSGGSDGCLWYTMPHVDGETLRARMSRHGPLPMPEILRITQDVSAALGYAHERGVVHRDVKPENILLTPQGQALLADFGIASAPSVDQLTVTGLGLGTPSYMSPEQIMGERPIMPRADVYALGVVVYEMLTGTRPFADGAPAAMLARRLTDGAPSVLTLRSEVPLSLSLLVQRALEVDPERRPATATTFAELLRDGLEDRVREGERPPLREVSAPSVALRRSSRMLVAIVLGAAALAAILMIYSLAGRERASEASVAVLPFDNRTGDTALTFLSDGLAEDLTVSLSRSSGLRVVPHSSSKRFRNSDRSSKDIAAELGVTHLLLGGLSRRGDSLRITVELVNVGGRIEGWSDVQTAPQRDLAVVMDSITRAISATLLPKTDVTRGASGPVTRDSLAYTYYLLAQHHFNRFTPIDLMRSVAYYDSVLARDPTLGGAWLGRASVLIALASGNGMLTGREALAPMRAALDTLMALDPNSGLGHALRGHMYTWFEWDWDAAGRELQRALVLAPLDPTVNLRASFLQIVEGKTDSALTLLATARQQDPTNTRAILATANAYFFGRRFEACLRTARRGLELDPGFPPGLQFQTLCLSALGKRTEAVVEARRAVSANRQPILLSTLAIVLAQADSAEAARVVIGELESLSTGPSFDVGLLLRPYAALNDRDRFMVLLDRAIADRSYQISYLPVDPVIDPVRDDPRFAKAIARTGLPTRAHTTLQRAQPPMP